MYNVWQCIYKYLRISKLLAESITECCCPVIRTDIVARHTAVFHWHSWCRVIRYRHCNIRKIFCWTIVTTIIRLNYNTRIHSQSSNQRRIAVVSQICINIILSVIVIIVKKMHLLTLWPWPLTVQSQNHVTFKIYQAWTRLDHSFLSYAADKQTNRQKTNKSTVSASVIRNLYRNSTVHVL